MMGEGSACRTRRSSGRSRSSRSSSSVRRRCATASLPTPPPLLLLFLTLYSLVVGGLGYGWTTLEWGWGERSADVFQQAVGNGTTYYARLQEKVSGLVELALRSHAESSSANKTAVPPSRTVITFVNGIYHSEDDWRKLTEQLTETFQREVRPFYNPSSGWWVADATKAGYSLVVRPNDDEVALGLTEHLRAALSDAGPMGRVLHLAHSGGALLTYLAAKHHLEPGETDRIDVATFGGARSLTRKYFRGRAVNYYAKNDPIAFVDRRAAALLRSAQGQGGEGDIMEVCYEKHNTSFVFIEGRARNSLRDHSLEGPTYQEALYLEAKAFFEREREGSVAFPELTQGWLESSIRRMRKRAAYYTGIHGYFSGKGQPHASSKWAMSELIPSPSVFLGSGSLPSSWRGWVRRKVAKWKGTEGRTSAVISLPVGSSLPSLAQSGAPILRSNETGGLFSEEALPGSRWANIASWWGAGNSRNASSERERAITTPADSNRGSAENNNFDVISLEASSSSDEDTAAEEGAAILEGAICEEMPTSSAEEEASAWSRFSSLWSTPWGTQNSSAPVCEEVNDTDTETAGSQVVAVVSSVQQLVAAESTKSSSWLDFVSRALSSMGQKFGSEDTANSTTTTSFQANSSPQVAAGVGSLNLNSTSDPPFLEEEKVGNGASLLELDPDPVISPVSHGSGHEEEGRKNITTVVTHISENVTTRTASLNTNLEEETTQKN